MGGAMTTRWMSTVFVAVALLISPSVRDAGARTLTDRIRDSGRAASIVGDDGSVLFTAGQVKPTTDAMMSVLSIALQRVAIRGIDFPVVATVPGFSYVYNPTLQTFERSTYLGPVFAERAETLGKGRFQIGASYFYADLDQVNGDDLGTYTGSRALSTDTFIDSPVDIDEFSLKQHWFNFSFTYGITDRWDANVLVPVAYTEMTMRGRQQYQLTQFDQPTNPVGYLDLPAGKRVGIVRAHIEEDTGKTSHAGGDGRIALKDVYRKVCD